MLDEQGNILTSKEYLRRAANGRLTLPPAKQTATQVERVDVREAIKRDTRLQEQIQEREQEIADRTPAAPTNHFTELVESGALNGMSKSTQKRVQSLAKLKDKEIQDAATEAAAKTTRDADPLVVLERDAASWFSQLLANAPEEWKARAHEIQALANDGRPGALQLAREKREAATEELKVSWQSQRDEIATKRAALSAQALVVETEVAKVDPPAD
jgi:hypothetical protein